VNLFRRSFDYLLGGPKVGGALETRLLAWQARRDDDLRRPHLAMRYVVVDTETTASMCGATASSRSVRRAWPVCGCAFRNALK
jgi:hypothetical protein